jgi:enoyl-CoA hydratase/carnithine racemase
MAQRPSTVAVEWDGPLATLRLSRPERLNAVSRELIEDVIAALDALEADRNVRVIVLAGAGRAFCAGADLAERAGLDEQAVVAHRKRVVALFDRVARCELPLVAAVHGAAYGGGAELALLCDVILAAEDAVFRFPEVALGIIPGGGGCHTLVRAVGLYRAKELVLTARKVPAAEALTLGLVSRVVPPVQLLPEAHALAAAIAANPPISLRQAKRALNFAADHDFASSLAFEAEAYNACIHTADRREALQAFKEKRAPRFTGS